MGRNSEDRDYRRLFDHRRHSLSPPVRSCLVNRLLRIKGFNPRINDKKIVDILLRVFEKFSVHHVTIYRDNKDCIAYVHFRNRQDALNASREKQRICICNSEAVVLPMWGPRPKQHSRKPLKDDYLTKRCSRDRARSPKGPQTSLRRSEKLQSPIRRSNTLEHVLPEDSPIATRTIYVGNLETNVTTNMLGSVFSRFGIVQSVDIKRSFLNAYAFIRFGTVDMAYEAKKKMSDHYIGNERCTIGYAKPKQSKMVWVGGLDKSVTTIYLVEEFAKHGAIASIDHFEGESHAFIRYKATSSAKAAVEKMRGFQYSDCDQRWKTDFGEIDNYRCTMLGQRPQSDNPQTLLQVVKRFTPEWTGRVMLKTSCFPIKLYLIGGHETTLDILRNLDQDLKMNKKKKLDLQEIKFIEKSINKTSRDAYGIFIGFSTIQHYQNSSMKTLPIASLITYLRNKVITVVASVIDAKTKENYHLYVFPPCDYSKEMLNVANSYLSEEVIDEDHIFVVMTRERP